MMNFFKRNLVFLVLIVAIITGVIFTWTLRKTPDETSDITISEYHAIVVLNEDATVTISETWQMNYPDGYSVRYRDIDYIRDQAIYPYSIGSLTEPSLDISSTSVLVSKNGVNVTNQIDVGYSYLGDSDDLGDVISCEPQRNYCDSIFTGFIHDVKMSGDITFHYEYVS